MTGSHARTLVCLLLGLLMASCGAAPTPARTVEGANPTPVDDTIADADDTDDASPGEDAEEPPAPLGPPCAHERECAGTDLCVEGVCLADDPASWPTPQVRDALAPETSPPLCAPWTHDDVLSATTAGSSDGDALFAWGTMAAAVRTDRATIWTRTETSTDVRVRYQAGADCEVHHSGWVATDEAGGRMAHVALEGLRPGTWYRYEVEQRGADLRATAGFFKTAPRTDSPVRLAFAADISAKTRLYGLFDELAASGAEIYLSLGDWPYADAGQDATDLDAFRHKHLETRSPLAIRRFMRAMAVHGVWDDHEVTNDWDARTDATLVELGTAVWREFFPIADNPPGEIYRHYQWGPGLEIVHLDLRSHRAANTSADDGDKSMLGAEQRQWLLDVLDASEATFKLVLTSVPTDWGTTGTDHWRGFEEERDAILDHIVERGIEGVVLLTADQHWFAAHHLDAGIKVFQTGALAQTPRRPLDRVPPEVVAQHKALNFGLLDYDPGPPATLTFTAIGNETASRKDTDDPVELYTETVVAGSGRIYIEPPRPGLEWLITGAHTFAGHGAVDLPMAPPGEYTIAWRALGPGLIEPDGESWTLRDGGKVRFGGTSSQTSPSGAAFYEHFDTDALDASRWRVVAQCDPERAADWSVVDGALRESGNCYADDGDDEPTNPAERRRFRKIPVAERRLVAAKRGTFVEATGVSLGDGWVGARVGVFDNDAVGLMYGIQSDDTFYRVSFDRQREYLRLVRAVDGQFEVIAQNRTFEAPASQWVRLRVEREGDQHRVWLDDELVLEATDDTLGAGRIALYSWGMDDARFDDVMVVTASGDPDVLNAPAGR